MRVDGQLVVNDKPTIIQAALGGLGVALTMEDEVTTLIADGRLVRVLEDFVM